MLVNISYKRIVSVLDSVIFLVVEEKNLNKIINYFFSFKIKVDVGV